MVIVLGVCIIIGIRKRMCRFFATLHVFLNTSSTLLNFQRLLGYNFT